MKSKINLSLFSILLTAAVFLFFLIGCIATLHEKTTFFTLLAIYIILIICALFYGVAYIETTPESVIMGSILKSRKIPVRNIESVELFQPTLGAYRLFASGGFLGYWGIFREGDIGKYYGFYGKASECFLIRMKNGDKYVLGCDNPSAMVEYIKSQIYG